MDIKDSKPLWWSVFILIASVVYLIPEAIFNAELVEVAGGIGVGEDELKNIELFGRFISGIGVGLLLIDLLIPKKFFNKKANVVLLSVLIMSLTWPVVYFGQKKIIDNFIIEDSTPEQRQHAVLSTVIKNSLIEESISIEGLNYDPLKDHTAVEKTFLSLFPSLIYFNDGFIDKIDSNKELIVRNMINNKMTSNFENYYGEFALLRDSIKSEYESYRKASEELNTFIREKVKNPDATTKPYWNDVRESMSAGWNEYSQAKRNFDARIKANSREIATKMYDYFDRKNNACSRLTGSRLSRCYNQYESQYEKEIAKYGIRNFPDHKWLVKSVAKKEEKSLEHRLVEGVFTFGLSFVQDGVEAIQEKTQGPQYVYSYTKNPEHYRKILHDLKVSDFESRSGYPYGMNVNQFNSHPKTRQSIVSKMREKGVVLPSSWTVNDRDGFNRAVIKKIAMDSESKWKKDFKMETSMSMEPNLSWSEFKEKPQIKSKIYENVPEKYSTYDINLDWNNEEFYKNIVLPIVERETKDYLDLLSSERKLFGDGEKYEVVGKDALRTVMVPPISMGISLFLVVLTLLKIPFKIYELTIGRNKNHKYYVKGGYFGSILIVLILPSLWSSNHFTEESNAISYFFEEIKDNKTSVGSYSLKWVLSIQPLLQPVGKSFDNALGIVDGFESINPVFKNMDKGGFPEPYANSKYQPLTIKTGPNYARVRVMNIVPRYYDGMILEKGSYDILVTADGYEPQRKEIELTEDDKVFAFYLEKK
jgi:hypothetical protein